MTKKNRPKTIPWEKIHKEWMKNPEYRYEYDKLQPHFEIANQIIGARVKRGITQEELAKRMGTGQAVISRLEGANAKPSISLIQRLADALGMRVELHFIPITAYKKASMKARKNRKSGKVLPLDEFKQKLTLNSA